MDERKRKKLVYLMFVGAVIYGAVNFMGRGKSVDAPTEYPTVAPLQASAGIAATTDSLEVSESGWARDPFAYGSSSGGGHSEERQTKFHLMAISESNGKLMAVINGKPVSKGEVVDGWTVVGLTKNGATMSLNGREIALEIGN